jgi:hypothetical protein
MGQKGQLSNLLTFLIMYFVFSIVFYYVAPELITNVIAPALTGEQFGDVSLLILRVSYIMWAVIPIVVIAAMLKGQQVEAS